MRIYLMTDMEGVAGLLNHDDWCLHQSRYYDLGRELLTQEVNAAVEGFFAGGASEILVADGHGAGGINPLLLDSRVELLRGFGMGFPFLLDQGYDAIAWVGQHAKAGTPYAHIAHTQWFNYIDVDVNGISIGEFGQMVLCAAELSIPCIFLSGDQAACAEAQQLAPGIETVSVKRGTTAGSGDDLDTRAYMQRNLGAIHIHPERARELIAAGALRAMRNWATRRPMAQLPSAPYTCTVRFRADGDKPAWRAVNQHPTSVRALMNMPFSRE